MSITPDTRVLLSFNGLAVLGLGLMPGVLMTLCMAAMSGHHSDFGAPKSL